MEPEGLFTAQHEVVSIRTGRMGTATAARFAAMANRYRPVAEFAAGVLAAAAEAEAEDRE